MLRIGLTGGIGAGKSEVARRLGEHGAIIIDADQLAREVVAPGTDGLREIIEAFGRRVLDEAGALDRAALAEAVFDDEPARRTLEGIIHPRVRTRTAELMAAAPPAAIVVNDVPLLVEAGLAATYHLVVVVEAAEATRVVRLSRHRGMPESQARERIRAQASDADRQRAADVLLRNDGELADLHAAVDGLWRDRLLGFEENVRLRRPVRRPEHLTLVPYDPTWPAQFDRLAARIRHATGGLPVDHIGSTAVAGLPAKEVFDIQLTVPDLRVADALAGELAEAGFPPLPGDWRDPHQPAAPDLAAPNLAAPDQAAPAAAAPDPAAWEKRLHGGADPARVVHLHVRPAGSPAQRRSLLMRDWLRADPAARARYADRERRHVGADGTTSGYPAGPAPWCDQAWSQAQQWAAETGWDQPR